MADERYKKFLGIEPNEDVPTYYELLGVSPDEQDAEVIEKTYKTQIRKLQQIRTSKDAGFIEFLKEEMRTARRVLTKPEKRKEYDQSLVAGALDGFKGFVGSLMVMGHINKTLYDTMVSRGVADGLSEEQAIKAIESLAQEHGATLEKTDPAGTPPPPPAQDSGEDEYSGYDDLGYDYVEEDDEGQYDYGDGGDYDYGDGEAYDDGGWGDEAPPPPPPPSRETVLQAPRGERPPPPPVQAQAPDFADEEESVPEGPWYRGMGERPPPWGRRTGSEFEIQKRVSKATPGRARSKEFEAAIRFYNLGAALAKVASDVHEKLRLYYPPGKPPAKMINGVPAQKVLDTEQSTYRECLKKFQTAMDKVGASEDGDSDLVRVRSTQSVTLVKGILDEIKQHKLRLMGGLPQQEEARAWQEFVGRTRPPRLTRVID